MEMPPANARETAWSKYLAYLMGGIPEYRTYDGSRCDVVVAGLAVEVEWLKKWREAPGQAGQYASQLGLSPVVILLRRGHDHDHRYLAQAYAACAVLGVPVWTFDTAGRYRGRTTIPEHLLRPPR